MTKQIIDTDTVDATNLYFTCSIANNIHYYKPGYMRLNKTIFIFVIIPLISCQGKTNHDQSTADSTSQTSLSPFTKENTSSAKVGVQRFYLIQSTLAAKGTFKLDAYNGDVYQLVLTPKKDETWQKLTRFISNEIDPKQENFDNYTLFVSPLAMRFTYLMNVNSGATWQLKEDPQTKEIFFSPLE